MSRRIQEVVRRALGVFSIISLGVIAHAASPELEKLVVADAATTKALGVVEATAKVQSGDRVAVQGKVKDFVDGQAVFTIADISMKDCKQNGESCPTPWDYCCETKETITKNTATVAVVGTGKAPIKAGLKGVNGVDHLVTITAEGIVRKDKAGNLMVLAEKIHVKK